MGYLLFGLAIIDGFLAYKTGNVWMGFLSGFMLAMGVSNFIIQDLKHIIEEMLK